MSKPAKPARDKRNKGKTSSKPGESAQAHAFLMDTLKAQEPAEAAGSAECAPPTPEPQEKRPAHRPPIYGLEDFKAVLAELEEGRTLTAICKDPGRPSTAWVKAYKNTTPELLALYMRAREEQQHAFSDEIIDISDNSSNDSESPRSVERAKLRVETRKWLMARLAAKTFGDKSSMDVTITTPVSSVIAAARKRARDRAKGRPEPETVKAPAPDDITRH